MAPASANALLKTLEEPPDGTGFVLIATHADVLLPTILSRCQRLRGENGNCNYLERL